MSAGNILIIWVGDRKIRNSPTSVPLVVTAVEFDPSHLPLPSPLTRETIELHFPLIETDLNSVWCLVFTDRL